MSDSVREVVRVCPPTCEGHPGKFRIMVVPVNGSLRDMLNSKDLDITPDQAADLVDYLISDPAGEKAMIRKLEKLLQVPS